MAHEDQWLSGQDKLQKLIVGSRFYVNMKNILVIIVKFYGHDLLASRLYITALTLWWKVPLQKDFT